MEFGFNEEQEHLARGVRDFLEGECPVEWVRAQWETPTRRSDTLWRKLAEIGVLGLRVKEEHGGLGLDEIDFALVLEEVGRAALAEPVVSSAVIGAPLLAELADDALASEWLPKLASGEARLAVGSPTSPWVADAHVADLLLLPGSEGNTLHALPGSAAPLTLQPSNDPARRLFSVDWEPAAAAEIASGDAAQRAIDAAFDRGAFACAAQQLGVCDRLIAMAADYARQRVQFGVAIGSFQAVKHQLADVRVKLEYARSAVYRAAHSVARGAATRATDVSMAKALASEAALLAARTALQVHGAIGYTWEQDLHVFMRRAWSLDLAWGDGGFHRRRVAAAVIDGAMPAESFGYQAA